MLAFTTTLARRYHDLDLNQKRTIKKYAFYLNLVLVLILIGLGSLLHFMRGEEYGYVADRIDIGVPTESDTALIANLAKVDTTIYMMNMQDINMKEKTLRVTLIVKLSYKLADFPDSPPEMGIFNGRLVDQQPISSKVANGRVTQLFRVLADVEPHYMAQMYPLDRELISVRISPKDETDPYYFNVVDFQDYTEGAQSDYQLIKMGYVNSVESSVLAVSDLGEKQGHYLGLNRSYMLFEHKNFYTYFKNIQYIILAISIALFALLINARTNSPKNGRIAVIGSSVFALSATVFQINASVKIVNELTIIDLITFYSGMIIVLCFLISIRTLRFLDEENYAIAKVFDLVMFSLIFVYSCLFFSAIYIYA